MPFTDATAITDWGRHEILATDLDWVQLRREELDLNTGDAANFTEEDGSWGHGHLASYLVHVDPTLDLRRSKAMASVYLYQAEGA